MIETKETLMTTMPEHGEENDGEGFPTNPIPANPDGGDETEDR